MSFDDFTFLADPCLYLHCDALSARNRFDWKFCYDGSSGYPDLLQLQSEKLGFDQLASVLAINDSDWF